MANLRRHEFALSDAQQVLLQQIERLESQSGRLNAFAVEFLAGCKKLVLTRGTLSEKQYALLQRMAAPYELAEEDAAAMADVMEFSEFLPQPVFDQFTSIWAWAQCPGAVLTEKQRWWVLSVRELLRFIGDVVGDKSHIIDADRWLQKVLAQSWAASDLLSSRERERLRLLGEKLDEKGAFSFFQSDIKALAAIRSKLHSKLANLSDTQREQWARRVAGLGALTELEGTAGLKATERKLVLSCRQLLEENGHLSLTLTNSLLRMAAAIKS